MYVQGDNARQRATLIPGALPDVEMCLTLPHIQKLKKNFSMELTIIETSAYQELSLIHISPFWRLFIWLIISIL